MLTVSDLEEHDQAVALEAMAAMKEQRALIIMYKETCRLVEVHAVGISTAGNPCMRVYQVAGETNSGEEYGWKLMKLEEVSVDIPSLAPRPGYKKGDKGMGTIFKEL